jgi:acyl carrier protein
MGRAHGILADGTVGRHETLNVSALCGSCCKPSTGWLTIEFPWLWKGFPVIDSEKILAIIAREAAIDRSRLVPDATLDSLAIASLDVINILFAVEDECAIELDAAEFEGAKTVQQFLDVILTKAKAAPQAVSQSST